MYYQQLNKLILGKLLADLKLGRACLEESECPREIKIHNDYLELDNKIYDYEIDLRFYQKVSELLIEVCPHYSDVVGDLVYNSLNQRTNNENAVDTVCTHAVIVREWVSNNGSLVITGYQLMSDKFKGMIFETGGQWLAALRFQKHSWDYFASRLHTSDIALFPYFCDLFSSGDVQPTNLSKKLLEILDKCLPDWYPLLRCTNLGL